jgi:hypothetical protein
MDAAYHARETPPLVRRAFLLGVLAVISAGAARAQPFVRVTQTTPFATTAPVFVPMAGSELRYSLQPGEFALLLWKARLINAELLLADDAGTRWGLGSANGRPPETPYTWSNFDWDVGRELAVFPMVRAIDGGTGRVERFEAVAMKLGPSTQFVFQENFTLPLLVDDLQWKQLATVTAGGGGPGQWLCFAQVNVESSHPTGVSVRLRVNATEYPVPTSQDPRVRFLSSGAVSPQMFFYATPLTLTPGDVVALEGTVNPRVGGPGTGASASVRDVRLLIIPQSVLEEVDEQAPTSGFNVAPGTQVVATQLPRTTLDGGWELLTLSVMLAGDGGTAEHELITEPGTPPFVDAERVTVRTQSEQPLLSTWVLRPVMPSTVQVLPQWWTRSFSGGLEGWGARSARWRVVAAVPVDAGVPDAGADVDAGADAGGVDEDAGVDAGLEVDAGTVDAQDDAGVGSMRRLQIGCGCGGGPTVLAVLAVLLAGRRRRLTEPR